MSRGGEGVPIRYLFGQSLSPDRRCMYIVFRIVTYTVSFPRTRLDSPYRVLLVLPDSLVTFPTLILYKSVLPWILNLLPHLLPFLLNSLRVPTIGLSTSSATMVNDALSLESSSLRLRGTVKLRPEQPRFVTTRGDYRTRSGTDRQKTDSRFKWERKQM